MVQIYLISEKTSSGVLVSISKSCIVISTQFFLTLSSRASLVGQTIKHLPAMQETWVQSLGQEDLEKEMATHSSILPGESHGRRSLVGPRGRKESDTTERLRFTSLNPPLTN